MRSFRFFFILVLFLGFGIVLGRLCKIPTPFEETTITDKGQENILILIIDYTLPQKLQGVWLASYNQDLGFIDFFPIFPYFLNPSNELLTLETMVQQEFELNRDNMPSSAFFEFVEKKHNLSWQGYIMIDNSGISKAVDEMGGIDMEGEVLDGYSFTVKWANANENPNHAYQYQAKLVETFCQQLVEREFHASNFRSLLQGVGKHITTDIEVTKLINTFGTLTFQTNLTCKLINQTSTSP